MVISLCVSDQKWKIWDGAPKLAWLHGDEAPERRWRSWTQARILYYPVHQPTGCFVLLRRAGGKPERRLGLLSSPKRLWMFARSKDLGSSEWSSLDLGSFHSVRRKEEVTREEDTIWFVCSTLSGDLRKVVYHCNIPRAFDKFAVYEYLCGNLEQRP